MNRSLTNMSLFNFDEIIKDSDKIIELCNIFIKVTHESEKLNE